MSSARAKLPKNVVRWGLLWQAILAAHGTIAVIWWWIMPGGFPVAHARFWANRVLPLAVAAAAGLGLIAAWTRKRALFQSVVIALPVAWTAASAVAIVIFPVSAKRFFLPALGGTACLWTAYFFSYRLQRSAWRPMAIAAVLSAIVGGAAPWTQRAGDPDTRPINEPLPEVRSNRSPNQRAPRIQLTEDLIVRASDAVVVANCGGLRIDVRPLLSFQSRSPDRFWTIFAPRRYRVAPSRWPTALHEKQDSVVLKYEGEATDVLQVTPEEDGGSTRIESFTWLPRPVYSHLNTYCRLTIRGHEKLSLSFSPCPTVQIDVEPADYPMGRPARLAYLDAGGAFHVVEARSGEKGPYQTLAEGKLARSEPLAITLYDEGTPACRIVLSDWAAQAGTALSPTAGWGLPVNAIQFSRLGNPPDATAAIYITLAGTSVGRGWDSVGHRAGTYRNRVRIEPAAE